MNVWLCKNSLESKKMKQKRREIKYKHEQKALRNSESHAHNPLKIDTALTLCSSRQEDALVQHLCLSPAILSAGCEILVCQWGINF